MIDNKWGDGEEIAAGIIARDMSVRWTTTFTPEKTGEVTFDLKGDDRCRLFIDSVKRIETDIKNAYYSFNAEKGKSYQVVIEYWQHADNAEVKFDMGAFEKQDPAMIAARVKDADVIIFAGGISAKLEGEDMPVSLEGFKGGDRTNIALPAVQTNLMKALKATGKPVVFVNMSGSAMGFEWEAANIPAILQAWYGGQSGGDAVADILFGEYNPAGRLPVTFYKNVNDLPDFEDYRMDNRTYRYFKGEPLYPFGFGLSYTSFSYDKLVIPVSSKTNTSIHLKVNVTNTGKLNGEEVVQLYVSGNDNNVKKPIRSLKGFQRIYLKAGESKTVSFMVSAKDLSTIDEKGKMIPLKGDVIVSVGGYQPTVFLVKEKKVVQKIIKRK